MLGKPIVKITSGMIIAYQRNVGPTINKKAY